ncbi:armadillo-type protein [Schizophyllum amplum]|uniref:Armadillo-type protein n=1 Tax=Schizophyllum amplum TaxID=97359 RepID=A0A550BXV8_9AGAR|nr:armadillo-type protein [Auriculariopsis ampla]
MDAGEGKDGAANAAPKDPNESREAHKAQKAVQAQRKAAKPHSTLIARAKSVWAQARRKNITPAERQKDVRELMGVIRGHVKEIAFKHDASRIVQTAVKYGSPADRNEIAGELAGSFRELAQNKYSRFLVTKLIRLCPKHRASILREFQGHVLRLLLHREASAVLADAFELYANAYERAILLRDFYGKETALFDLSTGEADKEKAKDGLPGVLKGVDEGRRTRILTAVRENLESVFNNPDKGAVTHAIVHRALWEYLTALGNLSDATVREKLYREAFDMCQDMLVEMVHTKDGSRVAREFLARGSAKDRKQIIKNMSKHIGPMCTDEDAQLVLFTALDVIDDTKLLAKSVVATMTADTHTLSESTAGRRALLYLLVPRNRRHFTPAQIAALAETDAARGETSKKAPEIRAAEVRQAASPALLAWVAEHGAHAVRDTGPCILVTDIMLYAEDGTQRRRITAMLGAASAPYPAPPADEDGDADMDAVDSPHVIDLPHAARLYKTLLQGGHFSHAQGAVERAERWDASAFAVRFADVVGKGTVVAMCTAGARGGVFVVAELLGALPKEKRAEVCAWFTPAVRDDIEAGDAKGKKVLLEKLADA